jgi:peptidoglycan/LPS O-acetylase OafA/YrhL
MTIQQVHLSHEKYRPDIDGLRALAVLAVVTFHAFPSLARGGFIGVDIFFVISGFLISTIIFENLDRGTFCFSEFYSRRIRRIFPALLVVLITCFTIGWFALSADEYMQLGKHIAGGTGFVANFILWNEVGYFDNLAETKPLLHLWSLGIEEQFYIVWPLLIWFAWRQKFNLLTITIVLTATTFIININGIKQDVVATFYLPHSRFWELLSGSLLAWFTLYKSQVFTKSKGRFYNTLACIFYVDKIENKGKTLANALSIVGLFLLLYGFFRFNKELSFPGAWALIPVLGTVLIIAAGPKACVNRTILSFKAVVWFGLISFPLYLWHWPLLTFARVIEGEVPSNGVRITIVALSIALAWLTCKLVENPLRFGKHGKVKVAVLIVLAGIIGYVGFFTYTRDGLIFRDLAKRLTAISEAKKDWHYKPTQLIDGKIVGLHKFKGRRDETVLFVGSSLMGQYFPRVPFIYSADLPKFSTIYASRNHCTPIPFFTNMSDPEKINCEDYYKAAINLALDRSVTKVVFAAYWEDFYVDGKLTKAAEKFSQDLLDLRGQGKKIYIITNPPYDKRFHPDSTAKAIRKSRLSGVNDYSIPRNKIEPNIKNFLSFGSLVGATIINPFDYLCSDVSCPVVLDGKPLYKDDTHMRASYAESHAKFIDELVND